METEQVVWESSGLDDQVTTELVHVPADVRAEGPLRWNIVTNYELIVELWADWVNLLRWELLVHICCFGLVERQLDMLIPPVDHSLAWTVLVVLK